MSESGVPAKGRVCLVEHVPQVCACLSEREERRPRGTGRRAQGGSRRGGRELTVRRVADAESCPSWLVTPSCRSLQPHTARLTKLAGGEGKPRAGRSEKGPCPEGEGACHLGTQQRGPGAPADGVGAELSAWPRAGGLTTFSAGTRSSVCGRSQGPLGVRAVGHRHQRTPARHGRTC